MKTLCMTLIVLLWTVCAHAQVNPPQESAMDRFLRYVKIDTQSQEDQPTVPSTKKQFDLANLLVKEINALGVQNVRVSEFAIVFGTVPGNLADNSQVPTVGFIAHMDTSPAVSGANVNPVIHKNYRGGDIVLPNDKTQVITVEKNPYLKELIGDDIITADGTTLLGSDDKAGVAEIMTMIDTLRQNPAIRHGNIAIAFTPDEEVSTGIEKFDVEGFGAKYAYTVDGDSLGDISDETWSARAATVTFMGKSTHPGTAKGIMVNAAYALADYLSRFPQDMVPETTEDRVGFVHPYAGVVDVEESSLKVLLRDFEVSGLDRQEALLRDMARLTGQKFPKVRIAVDVEEKYRNMKEVLKDYPQLMEYAAEATRRAGLTPVVTPIRGGTDGARLTFRGLPCPNLFTGGMNFHGKLEYNSRRGMEKSTEMLLNLVQIFAEAETDSSPE